MGSGGGWEVEKVLCVGVVTNLQQGDYKASLNVLKIDSAENESVCAFDQPQLGLEPMKSGSKMGGFKDQRKCKKSC